MGKAFHFPEPISDLFLLRKHGTVVPPSGGTAGRWTEDVWPSWPTVGAHSESRGPPTPDLNIRARKSILIQFNQYFYVSKHTQLVSYSREGLPCRPGAGAPSIRSPPRRLLPQCGEQNPRPLQLQNPFPQAPLGLLPVSERPTRALPGLALPLLVSKNLRLQTPEKPPTSYFPAFPPERAVGTPPVLSWSFSWQDTVAVI